MVRYMLYTYSSKADYSSAWLDSTYLFITRALIERVIGDVETNRNPDVVSHSHALKIISQHRTNYY